MKPITTLTTILSIACLVTTSANAEDTGLMPVGAALVGVNVLTSTLNGIFAFGDPPQRGPIVFGLATGVISALLGTGVTLAAHPESDTKYIGLGVAMIVSGLTSITFALININKVFNHPGKTPVKPDVSLNLRGGRVFRMGVSVEF